MRTSKKDTLEIQRILKAIEDSSRSIREASKLIALHEEGIRHCTDRLRELLEGPK